MAKVVKLHVHKNTLAKRKRAELKKRLIDSIHEAFSMGQVKAYALVLIDDEESTYAHGDAGDLQPSNFALLVREGMADVTGGTVDLEEPTEENEGA